MTSAELLELYARMKVVEIDPNGKGEMVRYQTAAFDGGKHSFDIFKPVSGFKPVTALEVHEAAVETRKHAAKLLAAADNMDRIVQEAMSNDPS